MIASASNSLAQPAAVDQTVEAEAVVAVVAAKKEPEAAL